MTEPTTQTLVERLRVHKDLSLCHEAADALEAQAREIAELKRPKEKIAPVQGWPQGIPWSLHLEAYAVYSKKWAPQPALIDLEGRNCRGGFGVGELDEFIPGWRERVSELTAVKAERDALRAELAAIRAVPVAIPADVLKAAKSMQKDHYRGPLAWAVKVIDFVADYTSPVVDVNAGLVEAMQADTDALDWLQSEYVQVDTFAMPTGGDDADVGWTIKQWHCGERVPRLIYQHFKDDLREAIRTARTQQAQKGGE